MAKPIKWLTCPIRRRRDQKDQREPGTSVSGRESSNAALRDESNNDYGSIMAEEVTDLMARDKIELQENKTGIMMEADNDITERTSNRQTVFHLLKGNLGPGCLSSPWCFSQLGIPLGVMLTLFIGAWTWHNSLTILDVKSQHTSNRRTVTYSDLGEVAFGTAFRTFTTFSIVLLQLAVCTVYLSFVGSNLQSFFTVFVPGLPLLGQSSMCILVVAPIVAFITLMPNLRALGPISEIAMGIFMGALILLAVLLGENYYNGSVEVLTSVTWSQLPIAICGILYAFEGICIVLPLEASMIDRTPFTSLFTYTYVVITVLYALIGGSCVWVLGQVDSGSITSFLMSRADEYNGYVLVVVANLLASAAILLTYALSIFPSIELWCQAMLRSMQVHDSLEPPIETEHWWGGELAYGPYDTPILRLSLVSATVIVAAVIPNVTQLIGLAGGIAGAITALIIPSLLALHFTEGATAKRMLEYMLLFIGIVSGVIGAAASVYDIFNTIGRS